MSFSYFNISIPYVVLAWTICIKRHVIWYHLIHVWGECLCSARRGAELITQTEGAFKPLLSPPNPAIFQRL